MQMSSENVLLFGDIVPVFIGTGGRQFRRLTGRQLRRSARLSCRIMSSARPGGTAGKKSSLSVQVKNQFVKAAFPASLPYYF